MRGVLIGVGLFVMAACTGPNNDGYAAGKSDTRQVPSSTTPGVQVTGYANVGVVRNF